MRSIQMRCVFGLGVLLVLLDIDMVFSSTCTSTTYDVEHDGCSAGRHVEYALHWDCYGSNFGGGCAEYYTASCIECVAGKMQGGNGFCGEACADCTAGKYSQVGWGHCGNCVAGKTSPSLSTSINDCGNCPEEQDSIAGSTCAWCIAGKKNPTEGALCTNCADGKTSGTGVASCSACLGNQESSSPWTSCYNCPAGQKSDAGQTCTNCNAGQTSLSGYSCTSCATGKISSSGQAPCANCPAGQTDSNAHRNCAYCSTGYTSTSGSACVVCADGYSSSDTFIDCVLCPGGMTTTNGGACASTACAAGRYAATDSWSQSNQYDKECLLCPYNTVSGEGANECSECELGKFANAEKTACQPCASEGVYVVYPRHDEHDDIIQYYGWLSKNPSLKDIRVPCLCERGMMDGNGVCVECLSNQPRLAEYVHVGDHAVLYNNSAQ